MFSQSALEHIRYDKQVFRLLRARQRKRLCHLHLVPATRSFFETLFHGYRRYGGLEVANLLALPGVEGVKIHLIGNAASRRLSRQQHFKHGWKRAWAKLENTAYVRDKPMFEHLRKNCLIAESVKDASFLAIVFHQTID